MERFFQPINLGDLKLGNRFVMAPVKTGYATLDGKVTERHLNYYNHLSKGGVSLIILEPVSVLKNGKEHPRQLCIDNAQCVPELRKIVDVLHKNNTYACLNLNHAGRAANPKATGGPPKAPSAIPCPSTGQTPQELTLDEIEEILEAFGTAAKRALDLGFDALEVQCGHGYLISQFLSERTNKRRDKYGRERTLFAKGVFEKVFGNARGIPVIIRISGNEFIEGGVTPKKNKFIISLAEIFGAAAIHIGFGNACDTPPWYFNHMALPEEPQYQVFREIRNMTNLPLIVVGRMASKEKLQKIDEENLGDIVAFARPLVADPYLPKKLESQDYDSILYCGYCLQGCLFNVKAGLGLGCLVNPGIDKDEPPETKEKLRCVVVGAGPAGMMAAVTLAKRGHRVKLYEKQPEPGGQFRFAPISPLKKGMARPLNSLIRQLEMSEVEVIYHREVDLELLEAESPDLVVISTGGVQNIPEIEGLMEQNWITSLDFFSGERKVRGERVLVIGAGMVGVEAAEILSREGKFVVATKRTDTIANDMEPITRSMILKELNSRENVELMPSTTVKRFTPTGVEVVSKGENILLEPFDTVVVASGMNPEDTLYKQAKGKFKHVELIGDAREPEGIFAATQAGYEVGMKY